MWFQQVEVPDDLVSSARDRRLAIFVAAGASRDAPSCLPFKQLVTDIGTQVSSVPTELQLERPDVFLGDLPDLKMNVHSLVAKAIAPAGSAPNRLHHAIMSLARSLGREGRRYVLTDKQPAHAAEQKWSPCPVVSRPGY